MLGTISAFEVGLRLQQTDKFCEAIVSNDCHPAIANEAHSRRGDAITGLRDSTLRVWFCERSRLEAPVAHGVAPVAVAGAAADGADLELVLAAGREAAHGQGAGAGVQTA